MAIKTNLAQIAEQVLRGLFQGDPSSDAPIKQTEIILMLPSVAQTILQDEIDGLNFDFRWLTDFEDVEILTDEAKDLKYSLIPAKYISLPNNEGIFHISTMKDQKAKFKAVNPTFFSMYSGMEAENLYGYVGYWIEGNRVYYTSKFTGVEGYTTDKVLMKLVASFDNYGDYDDIFVDEAIKFKIINALMAFYNPELAKQKDTVSDDRYTNTQQS